jgi:hypothetical protein
LNDLDALNDQHIAMVFESLASTSNTRDAIIHTAFFHFHQNDWDVDTRDIQQDWKFGKALEDVPGFAAAILLLQKDVTKGRSAFP